MEGLISGGEGIGMKKKQQKNKRFRTRNSVDRNTFFIYWFFNTLNTRFVLFFSMTSW